MKFSRSIHLSRLIAAKHDNFVKIVTGIRRCGKSYLLFELFKEHLLSEGVSPGCIVEINLEQDDFTELRNPIALGSYIRNRIGSRRDRWTYVLIDEIQLCRKVLPPGTDLSLVHPDDRESVFVTFHDVLSGLKNLPCVDVYVTGSNSKMLSTDIATQFRDRGEVIHVQPLSFAEFVEARGERETVYRHLIDYLSYGGLPEAVLKPEADARRYLASLYGTVYLKDIAERNKLRNDSLLEAIADTVMSSAAGLTNPTKLAKTVKSVLGIDTNPVTVRKYLGYFEDAFLVEKALRWDVKGRRHLDYPCKFYATDLGLCNARLGFRQLEGPHLMENALFNELRLRGCDVDAGVVRVDSRAAGVRRKRSTKSISSFVAVRKRSTSSPLTGCRMPQNGNKNVSRFCIQEIPSGKSSSSTTHCRPGHTTKTASPTWVSSTFCSTPTRWISADPHLPPRSPLFSDALERHARDVPGCVRPTVVYDGEIRTLARGVEISDCRGWNPQSRPAARPPWQDRRAAGTCDVQCATSAGKL